MIQFEQLQLIIGYFFVYAFLGWCVEIAYHASKSGQLINRGMLAGPVCPIYGFGMIFLVLILDDLKHHLLLLFLGALLICTLLELLVGLFLRVIFSAQWWDYKDEKWNVFGLICPKFSLYWGLGGVLLMRGFHPSLEKIMHFIPSPLLTACIIICSLILLVDTITTCLQIHQIHVYQDMIEDVRQQILDASVLIGEEVTRLTLSTQVHLEPFKENLKELEDNLQTVQQEIKEGVQFLKEDYLFKELDELSLKESIEVEAKQKLLALNNRYKSLLEMKERTEKRLIKAFPKLRWIGRYRDK